MSNHIQQVNVTFNGLRNVLIHDTQEIWMF